MTKNSNWSITYIQQPDKDCSNGYDMLMLDPDTYTVHHLLLTKDTGKSLRKIKQIDQVYSLSLSTIKAHSAFSFNIDEYVVFFDSINAYYIDFKQRNTHIIPNIYCQGFLIFN